MTKAKTRKATSGQAKATTTRASRSGSQQSREEVAARGARRVGLYLDPERNALAGELARALGLDLTIRGDLIKLWDAMAKALIEKFRAEKG